MPVLSTAYYSNYSSSSLTRNPSPNLRPYSSTYIPNKSRSSYDLTAYKPSSYFNSTHSSTTSSYKSPSSSLYNSNYNRWNSTGISGLSTSPSSTVTLTRYNQRRSSIDHNDEDYSPLKSSIPVAGLTNLGNTCYMNSVLQALYATRHLREYVTNGIETGGTLFSGLSRLFKEMGSTRSGYVNPSSFRSLFIQYQPKFRGYDQHDAQEFLRYLINGLHDEVNKAKRRPKTKLIEPNSSQEAWNQYKGVIDDSRLIDLFVGQFSSVIKCTECYNESSCWDPFWDLSLPLPRDRIRCDIEQCLKEFTAQEVLDDDEQPFCSRCKRHRRSTKRLTIQRSPQILILHLKKFANDGFKLSSQDIKVNQNITIDSKTYYLYACVCHHGYSSRSGHYTAYCQYDSKWFHFNDERVKDVSETFSASQLGDAYVLFYHQRNDTINYSSRL
jgi:ubiquitin carboxyl-terminal hydrolase 2/21